ncbi:SufE family protein [Colwellia sp. BRX10-4]|jgi:cysteine desulfuration protein SufE|uniref:SufE family protein n=1 Tax=Colwellia sp. BRX10-4 TaxID=2759843 RepID=UPI0015F4F8E4|nr:SufE family protein [Colwellia sp. BRX10-4]MBA6396140.1 SufE family protein [Colwellia sp. BRX10-4]
MTKLSIASLSESPFGSEIKSGDIKDTLIFFDDWEDRYRYIIDLGKELSTVPVSYRTDENLIVGCQSQVWLICEYDEINNMLLMAVDSEAQIVKGLAAIVLSAFNKRTPQAVTNFNIDAFFTDIDLFSHLSSMRGNGLRAMVKKILHIAKQYS